MIASKLKDTIKPLALPLWLRLHDSSAWKAYVDRTERLPRRFVAFGIGAAKTGTNSLNAMLEGTYRSAHEPETWILTHQLLRGAHLTDATISTEAQAENLLTRDARLNLEFESSWVLGLLIEPLFHAFPDARYVLTLREPVSWLNSLVNQQKVIGHRQPWRILDDYRFGPDRYFTADEAGLKAHNLYPVASYLQYWTRHVERIVDTVPEDRLLILKTHELSHKTDVIADFLGIPESTMDLGRTHAYRRDDKPLDLGGLVDPDFLAHAVTRHCTPVLERYF